MKSVEAKPPTLQIVMGSNTNQRILAMTTMMGNVSGPVTTLFLKLLSIILMNKVARGLLGYSPKILTARRDARSSNFLVPIPLSLLTVHLFRYLDGSIYPHIGFVLPLSCSVPELLAVSYHKS